jgi:oligoribonuclease NrnB/cAMP/cGMP phosphodiesterase (DHH superfamily)
VDTILFKTEVICIYHDKCADGFGSAWCLWVKNKLVDFHPAGYGSQPPDVKGKIVYILDFSYSREVIEKMAEDAVAVIILDHHKTAEEDLFGYPTPPTVEEMSSVSSSSDWAAGNVFAIFDMERSGAGISWDYFNGGERPKMIDYIEDRDLWKFKHKETRAFQANLFSYDYDFMAWTEVYMRTTFGLDGMEKFLAEGEAIERNHQKNVRELSEFLARPMNIAGYDVEVASVPHTLCSDVGHALAKKNPFGASYWDTKSSRKFSLRSTDDGIDVSEVAKLFGGGGHRNAAGFSVPRDHELAKC